MAPHLVVARSAHGFGHMGQTAPVVQALRQRLPELKVTIRSAAPHFKLLERFGRDVEYDTVKLDVAMVQSNALEVNLAEAAQAYQAFHRSWAASVAEEAKALAYLRPNLLLANIPYLSLAAAANASIPAVALCSLNWADIYGYYFGECPDARRILNDMLAAYGAAERFLHPEPRMPMHGIANGLAIGPIAQLGKSERERVMAATGARPDDRLIMISLGGMDVRLPVEEWQDLETLRLIVPASWQVKHPRITALERIPLPFVDVMASCDALVCKPGYCSFVKAACLGMPVFYLPRPNWPEAHYLVRWLERYARCFALQSQHVAHGGLSQLLASPRAVPTQPVLPRGVAEAADYCAGLIRAT
jgi:hypothetical protein